MTIAPDDKLAQKESKKVMVELTKVDEKKSKPKKLNFSLKKDVVVKLVDIASQLSEQKPITIDLSSDEHSDVEPSDFESEINKPSVTKQSRKVVKHNMGKASEVASAKRDKKSHKVRKLDVIKEITTTKRSSEVLGINKEVKCRKTDMLDKVANESGKVKDLKMRKNVRQEC